VDENISGHLFLPEEITSIEVLSGGLYDFAFRTAFEFF